MKTYRFPDDFLATKEELLNEYRKKPVRKVLQIDAWQQDGPDSVFTPDKNGIVISFGIQDELRKTDIPVRIHIMYGAEKRDVLKMLRRAYRFLVKDYDRYNKQCLKQDSRVPGW